MGNSNPSNSESFSKIVSLLMLVAVLVQINSAENSSEQAIAIGLYDKYLETAFEHPQYAEGYKQFPDYDSDDWKKYTWYVSRLLFSAESILALDLSITQKETWNTTIKSQLDYHRSYLISCDFKEQRKHYSDEVMKMVGGLEEVGEWYEVLWFKDWLNIHVYSR